MKTIYFVRHGQSEANAKRITAGSGLDVDLTQHGIDQALRVGDFLSDKKIQLIVSSPMVRALHTAQLIASRIRISPDSIEINSLFTERFLGDLTGRPHDELQNYFSMGATPPGGESSEAMQARVMAGLAWLKSLDPDVVLLVSHGGPGRAIRTIIRNEGHRSIDSLASIGNAEILKFTI